MIELVTVELTNFRSFSHATFEPLGIGQGMTAINGANGMGKSSVVHAIVWALYGVTPDGVKVSSLRRQDSEGDAEAKVVLRHDGQTIVITRAIRGRNDTTVASIEVDGVEQTNVSSRTATQWVITRFGLDSEAFLVAFVIRQKELDSLIRARPADRRKTIERLAGIERMSKALELTRAEARIVQKAFDSLPLLPNLKDLEVSKSDAQNKLTDFLAKSEIDKETLISVRAELEATNLNLSNARELLSNNNRFEEQIESAEYRLTSAEEKYNSVNELSKLATGSEKLVSEQGTVQSRLDVLKEEISAARTVANNLMLVEESLVNNQNKEGTLSEQLLSAKERLDAASKTYDAKQLTKLAKQKSSLEEEISELGYEKGAALGEWDRLKKALDTLTAHEGSETHGAECPTCFTHLDNLDVLIKSLTDSQEVVQNRGSNIAIRITEKKENLSETNNSIETLNNMATDITELKNSTGRIEEDLSSVVAEIGKLKKNKTNLSSDGASLNTLENEYNDLDARQRALSIKLAKLEDAILAKEALNDVKEAYTERVAELEKISNAYNDSISEFEKYDIVSLEQDSESMSIRHNALSEDINSMNIELSLSRRTLTEVEGQLEAATEEVARRKSLLAEVESKTAAATSLDEFRKDRLARLTPELSEVASDFVAKMTDGKYTSIMLDEDFTPILTDSSGAERPVAWLSGGEESAVALALRVAIGEVLAGQKGGLLILDEALTAQDVNRRQATMTAIRALPRQIITINHVSEATDMVDLVADVVYAEEGGSTIVGVIPENGRIAPVSDEMIDA
jgi:exonuclease SbcC